MPLPAPQREGRALDIQVRWCVTYADSHLHTQRPTRTPAWPRVGSGALSLPLEAVFVRSLGASLCVVGLALLWLFLH